MGTLRFFEEVVSFKIRRTFGFADYIILLVDPAGSICFPGIMRNFTRRKTELIPSFCGCGAAPDGPVGSAA